MTVLEQFQDAQERIKTLTQRPSNEEFLDLYAFFKQATLGNNNDKKPGMFDLKGQFKWTKWKEKAGLSKEEAMKKYVDLVDSLLEKYTHS
jgi:diazepam-binding inhibitor (GABA receptor modulating acyl-CoA-binding protein)